MRLFASAGIDDQLRRRNLAFSSLPSKPAPFVVGLLLHQMRHEHVLSDLFPSEWPMGSRRTVRGENVIDGLDDLPSSVSEIALPDHAALRFTRVDSQFAH